MNEAPEASDLAVVPARAQDRRAIENLFQLYVHDFTELWAGTPRGELPDDGLFPLIPLDDYWQDKGHEPLLIRVAGHLAGFALIDKETHSGLKPDFNMAEFFVARKHRRGGIGRRAAHDIFLKRRGSWEVAVARRNVAALWFWRAAIAALPGVHDVTETDQNDERWNGAIIRFRI